MKICIVSHDAGGAENVASYICARNDIIGLFVLAGPAIKIFERRMGSIKITNLEEAMAACDWCLCGTGWQSDWEWNALALAKARRKHVVAFLDHWINYRERFTKRRKEILPDEIWVADEYAKKLAEQYFPDLVIRQQPNRYLETLVAEIHSLEVKQLRDSYQHILYVLEPIRQSWGSEEELGEFQALNYFIEHKNNLDLCGPLTIRLRPHPSDPIGKYDQWVNSQMNDKITVDTSSTLAELIAWSDIVVGCHTYAMVIALGAKKRVVSSIPHWAPQCVLPQPEIIRLADFASKNLKF
ncbi:MAG: hypothetical protein KDJ22_00685 [Candidatus Competibacteraceae bacterium]|nr:hypothetical protein [Candidatus Competibacteraceae bacterium]MCP5125047.1 hypothetical protein [Gammaproteobacteria bacterium]